jgi:hypothetical protein
MVAAAVALFIPLNWNAVCVLMVGLMAVTVCLRVFRTVREVGTARVEESR